MLLDVQHRYRCWWEPSDGNIRRRYQKALLKGSLEGLLKTFHWKGLLERFTRNIVGWLEATLGAFADALSHSASQIKERLRIRSRVSKRKALHLCVHGARKQKKERRAALTDPSKLFAIRTSDNIELRNLTFEIQSLDSIEQSKTDRSIGLSVWPADISWPIEDLPAATAQ